MDVQMALAAAADSGAVVRLIGLNRITIKKAGKVPSPVLQYLQDHKLEVVSHLRTDSECIRTGAHIQPSLWVHRDGRAYCHVCDKYMGRL